jgi:hypothetical protein
MNSLGANVELSQLSQKESEKLAVIMAQELQKAIDEEILESLVLPWAKTGKHGPTGWNVYTVKAGNISDWIESQPPHMWNHENESHNGYTLHYVLNPELESWFLLRWS